MCDDIILISVRVMPACHCLAMQMFNSRSCQLILGAGALQLVGLKTITTKNLGTGPFICYQVIAYHVEACLKFCRSSIFSSSSCYVE